MFRKLAALCTLLCLAILPLQAGTIHEVFNQTYTLTGALGTTDLVTPPAADSSYLIAVYSIITTPDNSSNGCDGGTGSGSCAMSVSPVIQWTDDGGARQTSLPTTNSSYSGSGIPVYSVFTVRVKAGTHLTVTQPVAQCSGYLCTPGASTTSILSVQVQGW